MIKVLHVLPALDGGGIERIIYNYYIHMPDGIQFDFAICDNDKVGILEQLLTEQGCCVYHFPRIHDGLWHCIDRLKEIISAGHYDIVHVNNSYNSFPALYAALRSGVKVRIAHAHTSCVPESFAGSLKRRLFAHISKLLATDLFACGRLAGTWTWGKKSNFYLMRNSIEIEKFCASEEKRISLRNRYGLDNKYVLGNVARFSYEKNHDFLIDVFAEIVKQRSDAVLVLIGRGETEEQIRKKVHDLGLSEKVHFMGVRDDVHELLNMFDVFLLTSHNEGLPVTLVEVQANGLPAVVSDGITDEIQILDNLTFVSLRAPLNQWAKCVCLAKRVGVTQATSAVSNAGYDIKLEAGHLYEKYTELLRK